MNALEKYYAESARIDRQNTIIEGVLLAVCGAWLCYGAALASGIIAR